MKITKIEVGELATNCYFLINDDKCIIIDPGGEAPKIINFLENNSLQLIGYLITHSHPDHVMALNDLSNKYHIGPYISDDLFTFETIKTPGHTEDSVCYYFKKEKLILTGDTLFKETIGRFDLLGGNRKDLFNSLELLMTYPSETFIFPGHGESSTLGYEKEHNRWLQ